MPLARFIPLSTTALLATALSIGLSGCADSTAKAEGARILHTVDSLRSAPNPTKRIPFDQLKSTPCSLPDTCEARDACVRAFEHVVRAVELTHDLEKSLASAPDGSVAPQDRDALALKLIEANLENEQGNQLMPDCEKAVTDLRIRRKL